VDDASSDLWAAVDAELERVFPGGLGGPGIVSNVPAPPLTARQTLAAVQSLPAGASFEAFVRAMYREAGLPLPGELPSPGA
jgi:hypothetical protein